jgi:hypothetical protein
MVNLTVPGNSILTMPLPDTKAAPERFRGRYNKVKSFITHFELLLEQNNVQADKDRCELVNRYCSRKVTDFIQALPSYTDRKWDKLKEDLLKYYDADLDNKKYGSKDLVKLVKLCKEKKLRNLSAWREYGRKFITIGGWLLKKKKISEDEYATYYWNGIPKTLRSKVENRLLAKDPVRSLSSPFKVDEVNGAVEALLQRDRFDKNFAGSDDEDGSDDENGGDESSDSDDEDDLKEMRRRIKKKAKYARRKVLASDSDDSDDDEPLTSKQRAGKTSKRRLVSKDEPEIETLIKRLNSMSIDDPGYAALAFRALKIDPDVLRVIRAPVFNGRPTIPNSPQFPRPQPTFQPQAPPRMAPRFPTSRPFPRPSPDGEECFACGMKGHRMTMCPEMQPLIADKRIRRNEMGRYVFSDGRPIRRLPGETLVSAVTNDDGLKENNRLETHLIQVVYPNEDERTREEYIGNLDSDTSENNSIVSESESDMDGDQLVSAAVLSQWNEDEEVKFTYPVTRSGRQVSINRKEAMEAEYQLARDRKKKKGQGNEIRANVGPATNERTTIAAKRVTAAKAAERLQVPVPISSQRNGGGPIAGQKNEGGIPGPTRNIVQETPRGPRPVDMRRPEYNGRSDDAIMEDVTNRPAPAWKREGREMKDGRGKPGPKDVTPESPVVPVPAPEKPVRRSEVAAQVKTVGVLNQVLNTRIDLAIGEVLGISKDLSALLGDKIKPKSAKISVPIATALPVATSFYSKNRGLLIQLHMQCDGRPIRAIIDTGSQLNIVNKSICDTKIMRPIDNKEKISIADANGGQGKLEGMVANVPLNCGEVLTNANLYVGTHVPFELLLGRPWQRGNFVTIDERRDGTYLLFKDPKNLTPRYEILVSVDQSVPNITYELPVWDVPEAPDNPVSYHISIDPEPISLAQELNGPTDQPISRDFPFLVTHPKSTSRTLHDIYPSFARHPHSASISTNDTDHMLQPRPNSIQEWRANDIRLANAKHKTLPERIFTILRSMTQQLQKTTEARPGSEIVPLASQNLYRLDSEVLVAALADLPFLKRTNNTHPLILSTAEGVLLGQSTDPAGHAHADYVFLQAGLLNLTPRPNNSVTPASAFVRVFPELNGGPPQPWLLPYIGDPPSTIMVSLPLTKFLNHADNFVLVFDQHEAKKCDTTPVDQSPATLSTIVEEIDIANGDVELSSSKTRTVPSTISSTHLSPGAQDPKDSKQSNARTFEQGTTASSFTTNKMSITTDVATLPNGELSTPPLTPDRDDSDSDDGQNDDDENDELDSTSSSDRDGEHEMDLGTESETEADMMEWEELKREIKVFCAKEGDEAPADKPIRAPISVNDRARIAAALKTDRDSNKENGGALLKVDRDVYDRLYQSYCQIVGEAPTEEIMTEMQNSWINYLTNPPAPFVPRNNPAAPLSVSRAPHLANKLSTISIPPPRRVPYDQSFSPTTHSPLSNSITYQPPEPPMVFLSKVQDTPVDCSVKIDDSDSDIPPLVVDISRTNSSNVPRNGGECFLKPPPLDKISILAPAVFAMEQDVDIAMPTSAANATTSNSSKYQCVDDGEHTDTVPSSPINENLDERTNRFQRPRKVGKEELLEAL